MSVDLAAIETSFLASVADIEEVKETHDVEPVRFDDLPAVSLLFVACPQVNTSTGFAVVTWQWEVNITVPNNDLREAQEYLKAILPQVLAITRTDPALRDDQDNPTCDWALLEDRLDPPGAVEDMKALRKTIYLTAQTTEST